MTVYILLTLVISAAIGWLTIPNIIIISKRKRLFDAPNDRKVHTQAIPRLGGISFLPGVMFSFCSVLGLRFLLRDDLSGEFSHQFFMEFLFFTAGLISLFFVGLADDLVGIGYKNKFIIQLAAAFLLISSDIYLSNFFGLFGVYELPKVLGIIITLIIVVGVVNSFNLIDGVDGLCSGLGSIAILTLSGWFWYNGIYVYAMLGMSMVGVLVVFYFYNVRGLRLKIFMGDGGSLMLGYMVAYLGLKFTDINVFPYAYSTPNAPILVMSIIFIPVFDTIRVFCERIMRGKSPFYPDKTHIHHLFLKLEYTHLQSTGMILIIAIAFIVINFALQNININILFVLDVLLGLIFLNWVPKYFIKKRSAAKVARKNKIVNKL